MADVSHELGALRYVVDSSLSSKVAMFNKQTEQHQQNQLLNPFSGANGRVSPKPTFSKNEYGKPLVGSLTEMRGQKANMHVLREMLELCQIISSEGYNVKDEPGMRVIPFGELFNIYNYISDKVVGILLRARKHKLVEFEGEMLFQRRDDDVPIFLLKPILEIRRELEVKIEDIKRASSPAPQATTLMLDKGAHERKLQEAGLAVPKRKSASRTPSPSPVNSKAASPAPAEPTSRASNVATEQATLQRPPVPPRPVAKVAVAETAAVITETVQQPQPATASAEAKAGEPNVAQVQADTPLAAQATESTKIASEVPTIEVQNAVDEESSNNGSSNNNDNNNTDTELPTIVIETTAVHTRTTDTPTEPEQTETVTAVEAPLTEQTPPIATAEVAQNDVSVAVVEETTSSTALDAESSH